MELDTFNFFGRTDTGRIRSNNEDGLIFQNIWDTDYILMIVVDGVGGHEGGEIATEIAVTEIPKYLKEYPFGERLTLLKQAVTHANNVIFDQRKQQQEYSNMSCVLTSCIVDKKNQKLHMVHIGDTRLYQFYDKRLSKLSHDHSLVGYREEIGELTEDEAMNHPQRNIIGRDLGSEIHKIDDEDFLEAQTFYLSESAYYLLCSDGLTDMLKAHEIENILLQKISLEEKVNLLIDNTNLKGGKDNVTLILLDTPKEKLSNNNIFINENEIIDVVTDKEKPIKETIRSHENKENFKTKSTILKYLLPVLLFVLGIAAGWFLKSFIENKWIKAKKVKPEITEIAINPIIKKDTLQNSEFKLKDSLQKF